MDIGKIRPTEITSELSKSYLDYAMSVIVARALPDVRDGLKPVHRRILFAMHSMGLIHSGSFSKSAKVVGEVLGKFHPHGDSPVYEALVRLAQDFSMRYPLVFGQGNFGSVDGDPPAAMRYTECKLAHISDHILSDIEKETVDFVDNFDATIKEPTFLPALLPNLLLMGSEGIAVGMATKIPPHNLTEVASAIIALVKKGKILVAKEKQNEEADFFIKKIDLVAAGVQKELSEEELKGSTVSFESEITTEEIMESLPGPDFPTGGAIYDALSLKEIYSTGRGKIVVRGIAEIKEGDNGPPASRQGKTQIIISELPYQVNKSLFVASIADLYKDKKIIGISALRDESDKDGLRVAIDLKRDARPKSVLNNLYKHTKLQTTFPANFVALIDGTPFTVNIKQILTEYVKHRQRVVTRRTIFDLTSAKKRAHILEGLKIALDNLDAVIKTIRASLTQEDAKNNLIKKFALTEIQSIAILDMQLRRLAALEREKIEKEYQEIKKLIDRLIAILKGPQKVLDIIVEEVETLKEKFGDTRKTKIYKQKINAFSEQDLVAKEEAIILVTKSGYVKRSAKGSFRSQRRGGKGVIGMATKDEDEIELFTSGTTHDTILFFTDFGRVFGIKAWEIPESARTSKGQALVNFINTSQGESIRSIVPMDAQKSQYLTMVTAKGTMKKSSINQFKNLRANGLIAIKLDKGDSLVAVHPTSGHDHILIITSLGKSIRFPEENIRSMGRATTGVRGIRLAQDDKVIAMEVFPKKIEVVGDKRKKVFRDILIITQHGLGKRSGIHLFPIQRRGGKGVKCSVVNAKTGSLATALMVDENIEEVAITSKAGQVIKLPLRNIPRMGRSTQGVILMRFAQKGDIVAAATTIEKDQEEE